MELQLFNFFGKVQEICPVFPDTHSPHYMRGFNHCASSIHQPKLFEAISK